jgi:hypothetical protein
LRTTAGLLGWLGMINQSLKGETYMRKTLFCIGALVGLAVASLTPVATVAATPAAPLLIAASPLSDTHGATVAAVYTVDISETAQAVNSGTLAAHLARTEAGDRLAVLGPNDEDDGDGGDESIRIPLAVLNPPVDRAEGEAPAEPDGRKV